MGSRLVFASRKSFPACSAVASADPGNFSRIPGFLACQPDPFGQRVFKVQMTCQKGWLRVFMFSFECLRNSAGVSKNAQFGAIWREFVQKRDRYSQATEGWPSSGGRGAKVECPRPNIQCPMSAELSALYFGRARRSTFDARLQPPAFGSRRSTLDGFPWSELIAAGMRSLISGGRFLLIKTGTEQKVVALAAD